MQNNKLSLETFIHYYKYGLIFVSDINYLKFDIYFACLWPVLKTRNYIKNLIRVALLYV